MISLCLPYNSKTITSIKLRFGGEVFHGIQMDSFKFGVIFFQN